MPFISTGSFFPGTLGRAYDLFRSNTDGTGDRSGAQDVMRSAGRGIFKPISSGPNRRQSGRSVELFFITHFARARIASDT